MRAGLDPFHQSVCDHEGSGSDPVLCFRTGTETSCRNGP